MHNLHTVTALGHTASVIETIGDVTTAENDTLSIASIAARIGYEDHVKSGLIDLLGDCPKPNYCVANSPLKGFWIGPNQWMIYAPFAAHELIVTNLSGAFSW